MEIASGKILDKMEQLIKQARAAESAEQMKGCVMAVQALCEVLTEGSGRQDRPLPSHPQPVQYVQNPVMPSVPQEKPLDIEEANGDSLFDF